MNYSSTPPTASPRPHNKPKTKRSQFLKRCYDVLFRTPPKPPVKVDPPVCGSSRPFTGHIIQEDDILGCWYDHYYLDCDYYEMVPDSPDQDPPPSYYGILDGSHAKKTPPFMGRQHQPSRLFLGSAKSNKHV